MAACKETIFQKFLIIGYFINKMWSYKKRFFVFFIAYLMFLIIQPIINILFPRYIIDSISNELEISIAIRLIVIMIIATIVVDFLNKLLDTHLSKVYYEDLNRLLEANVGKKCMGLQFAATESQTTLDYINNAKLGVANGYSGGMNGLFKAMGVFVSNMVVLLLASFVVIKFSWYVLAIVFVNVAINTFANRRINSIQLAQFEKLSSINRGYNYLLHTLSDIRYGKDIRLFGARQMMLNRVDDYNKSQANIAKGQAMESQKYIYISKLDMAITTVVIYYILSNLAVAGQITIGEFTMLAASSALIVTAMNTVLQQILELNKFCQYAHKYINFLENNQYEESGNIECNSFPDEIEIEFKNVSFIYPGQNKYALKDINVLIRKGDHISIVGLNGAGKTTFIKLLCRLYTCTEGEILLNGINIMKYNENSYRSMLAAVFQDFQLLNFSIKENIIVSEYDSVPDEDVIEVIKQVGLFEKISSLPLGLSTPVFRYFDLNGFEPSGGEQQKLAMARALFKNAPILVLDEPTAALDPIAEREVYEKFDEMTKGKTTIFISHRLASCKFCNCIFVFNDGKIVEKGTHRELVSNQNGLYAHMFETQAQNYVS